MAKAKEEQTAESTALVAVKASSWNAVGSLAEAIQVAEIIGKSNALPDVRNVATALLKILAGGEMGFGPFASLVDVHIIEGKPSIGAHLRAAAIKRSGRYDYTIKRCDREACEIEFRESQGGKWVVLGVVAMGIEEAIAAGLTQGRSGMKANWKSHPDDMLFARCISKGYRRYCPDLTGGVLAYDPDELDGPIPVNATVVAATSNTPEPEPKKIQASEDAEVVVADPKRISEEQVERMGELITELELTEAQWKKAFEKRGVKTARELTPEQASEMIRNLEAMAEKRRSA